MQYGIFKKECPKDRSEYPSFRHLRDISESAPASLRNIPPNSSFSQFSELRSRVVLPNLLSPPLTVLEGCVDLENAESGGRTPAHRDPVRSSKPLSLEASLAV